MVGELDEKAELLSQPAGPENEPDPPETPAEVETETTQSVVKAEPTSLTEISDDKKRIEKLEVRLKIATILVATVALVASGGSATAAWFSWRTARAAEGLTRTATEIQRQTLETAGANWVVSDTVSVVGGCDDGDEPLEIHINVQNIGRLPGRILGGSFGPVFMQYVDGKETESLADMASTELGDVTVPGQDATTLNMRPVCKELGRYDLPNKQAGAWLATNIDKRTRDWAVKIFFSNVDENATPLTRIMKGTYCTRVSDTAAFCS